MIIVSSLMIKNWMLRFSSLGLKKQNSVSGEPDTDCAFLTPSGFIPIGVTQHPSVFLSLRDLISTFYFFSESQAFVIPINCCSL